MNIKRTGKKKGITSRVLAMMLCCILICGLAVPSFASAVDGNESGVSTILDGGQVDGGIGLVEITPSEPQEAVEPSMEPMETEMPSQEDETELPEVVNTPISTSADEETSSDTQEIVMPSEEVSDTQEIQSEDESQQEAALAPSDTENLPVADEVQEEAKQEFDCEKTASGSGYILTVRYDESAGIPENAELSVNELTGSKYESCFSAVQSTLAEEESLTAARFFDIRFYYEGQEIQPASGSRVCVEIKFTDDTLSEGGNLDVVRVENGSVKLIDKSRPASNVVSFETDSASVFGVTMVGQIEAGENGDIALVEMPVVEDVPLLKAPSAQERAGDASIRAIGGQNEITIKVGGSETVTSTVTGTQANNTHRESWSIDNDAVATVIWTLGSDNKATSATITGVSAGTTTVRHTYYTTRSSMFGGTTWAENTETITVTVVEPEQYTVSFNVGEDAAADGVTLADIIVTENETVTSLPLPSWTDGDGQAVKVFAGWYSDADLTTEFNSSAPVTSNITLYAKWVEADAEGVYYVNFYGQDGQTVHLTLSAAAGKAVSPAPGPTLEGKVFVGWSTELQGESDASALNAFNFSTAVSEAATGNTLNLYAWYAPAVQVSFVANGGIAVPTQFIAAGGTATYVAATRTGYTFRGWSSDPNNFTEFNFSQLITVDTTLYAFWDANLVPVTLVYMYENANDAGHTPAGVERQIVYAPAGSYLSIEKRNITALNQSHNVRYSESSGGSLTGNASSNAAGTANATIPDISGTYFQYESASNDRFVMPDGSTVFLVYFNRARVTLTFEYDQNGANGSIDYTTLIKEEDDIKHYAVSYEQKTSTSFNYTFTAKYGEDISAVWPQVGWVKNDNGQTPSYSSGSGWNSQTYTFYGWKIPGSTNIQVSNMYTLESVLFMPNGLSIQSIEGEGYLVGSYTITDVFQNATKDWLIYARTTLPGEDPDFTYGGKNYTIYEEASQLGYSASGTFGYKTLNGCQPATSSTLYTTYPRSGNNMSITNLTVQNGTLKSKFDDQFSDQISVGDNCQVLLYNRSELTLSVWVNDDTYNTTPQTAKYLYGDWIYNDDSDKLVQIENDMSKEGYRFAGWFTNPDCTQGTEYVPTEDSRIEGNLNLYGKWESDQFLAEYYLYTDDSTPYTTQGFAEGEYIDDKLVPHAVQDSFLGWYWYQNGRLVPFDFTSAVGGNHVNSDGVLKLYAKWKGTTGKVSYLPGIGGDNATQEVVDSRDFEINEAAVQMPRYTDEWPSGVPTDPTLTFVGWKAPNGAIYQPGRYVLVTRVLMQFEAQWSNDAVKLIYNANGGEGTSVEENWSRHSVVDIWDNMDGTTPHFTRENYTLLGWDTNPNATEPTYALGTGTITLDADVTTLYAIWKQDTAELTVMKTLSGNMYDPNKAFAFTVTYGDKTEEFTLKGGDAKTITVPVGVTVIVKEESDGYASTIGSGTTVEYTKLGTDGVSFTMPAEDAAVVFNNAKDVIVDTGVLLDSLPYILILAVVAVGGILFFKKRRNREDD